MISRSLIAAAGNAGGESLYVEDVFSTYLYTGTGSNQTITNGIDFSGDGGLVWLKNRVASGTNNVLLDTERGGEKFLYSNTADSELDFTGVYGVTFNNNGFTLLDTYTGYNASGETAVSWSFRKAEKFFDVVTYTGNGTAGRTVSHNLGSVPGCVIVKSLGANNWQVYHNGLPSAAYSAWLNSHLAPVSATTVWNSTDPTSTEFTVGSSGLVNNSGTTYVAYLFASDAEGFGDDGDESIIKCGSYTGNGSTTGPEIDLGFEPQWLMIRASSANGAWYIQDSMRGLTASGADDVELYANLSGAEFSRETINVTSTGFQPAINHSGYNSSGVDYIYIAIRRPMKTPESGTEVFDARYGANTADEFFDIGFDADLLFSRDTVTATSNNFFGARLTRQAYNNQRLLWSNATTAETVTSGRGYFGAKSDGYYYQTARTSLSYAFKRATGFFDVVAYKGTGTTRTASHNLGSTPAVIIVKRRDAAVGWPTYHEANGNTGLMYLNTTAANATSSSVWGSTSPTDTEFTVGTNANNISGGQFVAYLFATLAGVSKVGSYTGTAATLNVDCGFSAGARFVLIKRTDSTGEWYVWDSARGIVAGNDPYLLLHSGSAQVTSTDYIDPLNAGFTVTSSAPASLNASGGTYIFLAIA